MSGPYSVLRPHVLAGSPAETIRGVCFPSPTSPPRSRARRTLTRSAWQLWHLPGRADDSGLAHVPSVAPTGPAIWQARKRAP